MKKLILAIAMVMTAMSSFAAINDSAAIMFPVLDMGAGARAMGMGEAFTAISDDSSAVYWNAAGLGNIKRAEAAITYNKWFMDTMFSQILIAVPIQAGTIGADLTYMNLGEMPVRDIFGATTRVTYPYLAGGSLSYGISFGELSAGATFKIISQSVDNVQRMGFAGDVGVLLKTGIFAAGLSFQNAGTAGAYSLPMNLKAGIAVMPINSPQHALTIAVDIQYLFKDALSLSAGAEYLYMDILAIRAGYKDGFGQTNLEGLKGLSAGAGVKISNLSLDYAIVPYGDLGVTHRVTLSFVFGDRTSMGKKSEPDEKSSAYPVKSVKTR